MIAYLIRWSVTHRLFVLAGIAIIIVVGLYSVKQTPIDAIPDLSETQVIIKTHYPGQAPQLVQDQVTYPLTTAMLSVPGATTVRGYSFYGDSYIYVIFDEDTDLYWARSRVLEYLSQAAPSLPENVKPQLGPDATGVGWVYLYALIDKTGQHDLSELRSLQDWFLTYELQTLAGVSEVATVGGMVKQYQITADPEKLRAFGIPLSHIQTAVKRANQEVGGSVIEMAEAEYIVHASGYLQNKKDIENIPLGLNHKGTPLRLKDVANIGIGPQMRRGIAELNGKGETVGGIIVMRNGENAQTTIQGVKKKLTELKKSLPEGVEIVTVYDRSELIERAVKNLWQTLAIEFFVVALVCIVFLMHVKSALVAIISLPIGILIAFIVMNIQGINANIMSLGGIAVAIGTMIDGAIVMIENMHKNMEQETQSKDDHWKIVVKSATEVGPPLFFSLLIITVSFLPVFALESHEGKMFSPLAYTKSYSMAAAAILSVTLVPVLIGYFIRRKNRAIKSSHLNRAFVKYYKVSLKIVLDHPKLTATCVLIFMFISLWPIKNIGSEFIPTLDEGDLMYMPTTYPGISIGKARELLQQTDKLIATVPEVESVFGKVGRAETATDPAPLTMIETFIRLKPKNQWREGVTSESLQAELNALIQFPGVSNAWVMPIKTRIDMLTTGIKTPVGIKIAGPELEVIQDIGQQLEMILQELPGTASVYSERVKGGRYIKIDINREKASRYGLNIEDIQQVIAFAIGGKNITEVVEGQERYPINLRYPQSYRNTPEKIRLLPLITPENQHITLGDVANIYIEEGPSLIKSENARINGWTLIDIQNTNIGGYVEEAKSLVDRKLSLPAGYSIHWSGQYEYMQRVKEKLTYIVPLTLITIIILLLVCFRNFMEPAMIIGTMPFALAGGVWLIYLYDFNFSVSVGVGFIALAGIAVETAVIMLIYLNQAWHQFSEETQDKEGRDDQTLIKNAILDGASARVRPVLMTAGADIVGLLPILYSTGTGSEIMSRLVAPMVGGMVTVVGVTLFIIPSIYMFLKTRPTHIEVKI